MSHNIHNQNDTREIIMKTTQCLCERHNFENITVTDICRKSGISRPLFYYHFKDKYDVVNSIYAHNILRIYTSIQPSGGFRDLVIEIFLYLNQNRNFYKSIIKYYGQNSFYDFLLIFSYNLNKSIVQYNYIYLHGSNKLPRNVLYCLEFYSSGCVGMLRNWINTEAYNDNDINMIADKYIHSIPDDLKAYFQKLPFSL